MSRANSAEPEAPDRELDGAHVDVEQISSRGAPVADIILSHVASRGADMIVIGAYSHARSVEMVFGGVTRTLLTKATVPVLMSR